MFTPEGYWSWSEMVEATSEWTLEIVATSIAPEIPPKRLENAPNQCRELLLKKLVSNKSVENLSEAAFAYGLLELWILANFMDTYDAVLCSPEAKTLRCPPLISAHGDALDWWLWPLSKEKISNGEAHRYFEAFRAGKFHIQDARSRFCAIDFETGDVKLKPNSVSLLNSASYGFSDSEESNRFIDEQIRPLIGWSLCWNDDVIPETRTELYSSLGFGDLDWSAFDDDGSKSRTSAMAGQNILDCVMTAYPNGKGTVTWQDVEVKVGYSRRSIMRALKQNGQHSTWATTGQSQ
jgi:hypothetical protein